MVEPWPTVAYQHAMRRYFQTPAEAKKKACQFINSRMKTYISLINSTDPNNRYRALMALGEALHPVMDSTSPSHEGWQLWNIFDVPGIQKHGDFEHSVENLNALTPQLLAKTTQRIRRIMNGENCECVLE